MVRLSVRSQHEITWHRSSKSNGLRNKGAPGIECRTYSQLVSPGLGPEKKKWRALQIAFRMFVEHCIDLYKVLCRLLSLNHTSGNGWTYFLTVVIFTQTSNLILNESHTVLVQWTLFKTFKDFGSASHICILFIHLCRMAIANICHAFMQVCWKGSMFSSYDIMSYVIHLKYSTTLSRISLK